jgi:hypothetical protein
MGKKSMKPKRNACGPQQVSVKAPSPDAATRCTGTQNGATATSQTNAADKTLEALTGGAPEV